MPDAADEAVEALWKGYRRYSFSNFRANLLRDSRLTERAAVIIQRRASGPEQGKLLEGFPTFDVPKDARPFDVTDDC